jgi:hypothetical protein
MAAVLLCECQAEKLDVFIPVVVQQLEKLVMKKKGKYPLGKLGTTDGLVESQGS